MTTVVAKPGTHQVGFASKTETENCCKTQLITQMPKACQSKFSKQSNQLDFFFIQIQTTLIWLFHSLNVGFGLVGKSLSCICLPNGSGFEAESNLKSFRKASRAAISSAISAVSPGAKTNENPIYFLCATFFFFLVILHYNYRQNQAIVGEVKIAEQRTVIKKFCGTKRKEK